MCNFVSVSVFPQLLDSLTLACTVCDTDVGVAVRAGIFNASFLPTLLEVLAPFPVLGLVLLALDRYLPD